MNTQELLAVRNETVAMVRRLDPAAPVEISCPVVALAAMRVLVIRHGMDKGNVMFQGGSASWPLAAELPNGATHWSYEWCGPVNPFIPGALPEMHCWLVLRNEGWVLDLTTGWQAGNAKRFGLELAPLPEVFLGGFDEVLALRAKYVASEDATTFGMQIAAEWWSERKSILGCRSGRVS